MTEVKFYQFGQHNPGGHFDTDMPRYMWIEALSEDEACEIAEQRGVYFDGVDEGIDCPCCGDRWYRPYESLTREEVDETLARLNGPDAFKWAEWEDPEIEFKIVEKKD